MAARPPGSPRRVKKASLSCPGFFIYRSIMPYKNVHYVKLMLELLDDKRFIKQCSDSQKLDYILWLAMAGLTQNDSEEDYEWFKSRFYLNKSVDEIRSNLCFLLETFPKMYRQPRNKKNYVKFKKFKELHNPLRNADGTPKDSPRMEQSILEYIILEYIKIKNIPQSEKELIKYVYKRNCRAAKQMYILAKKDKEKVAQAIQWLGDIFNKKGFTWSLETILKWFPDYLVGGKKIEENMLLKKFGLKEER